MIVVEKFSQIVDTTDKDGKKRPNKFDLLEDQIVRQKVELTQSMSDFLYKIKITRDQVSDLEANVKRLSNKIDINVSYLLPLSN